MWSLETDTADAILTAFNAGGGGGGGVLRDLKPYV